MNAKLAAVAAIMTTLSLGGCAQLQEDALALIPKPPIKPSLVLANSADTSPPILQPGCYAIPDRAWDEEGLSEAEPWAPKCKPGRVWPGYHGVTTTTFEHRAKVHHRRAAVARVHRTK